MTRKRKLTKHKGILLDVGCGSNKQQGFVGMDKREVKGVDIVHDLEVFPYPLEDNVCLTIVGSHIFEHIKPWLTIDFMNELWRIIRPLGQLALSVPYGWSYGYLQDPTHCNPVVDATFQYFDPNYPLYDIYKPKPWLIEDITWQVNGNLEIVLRKAVNEKSAKEGTKKS